VFHITKLGDVNMWRIQANSLTLFKGSKGRSWFIVTDPQMVFVYKSSYFPGVIVEKEKEPLNIGFTILPSTIGENSVTYRAAENSSAVVSAKAITIMYLGMHRRDNAREEEESCQYLVDGKLKHFASLLIFFTSHPNPSQHSAQNSNHSLKLLLEWS
jgi:hypothetical protein